MTLGLFLLAPSLAAAEKSAVRLVEGALADRPDVREHAVDGVEAVLVPGPWWGD
ncbi:MULTISPECIES: hypothetical protein [unclassified Streptomyces]|uniref:hypothetical protein n=1 Tax=unclassified Streptomyces TaxID=2593676 RepID=UPI001F03CAFF|nr:MULTISPECIES: hypothetical protein [unclassified Streptomyces]MCH0566832.1 hypothetical protein [Streptomyces sp. MUM 2J]MCH0570236.1 hypothetical protein [Streptomyces sp. MUM 136J]